MRFEEALAAGAAAQPATPGGPQPAAAPSAAPAQQRGVSPVGPPVSSSLAVAPAGVSSGRTPSVAAAAPAGPPAALPPASPSSAEAPLAPLPPPLTASPAPSPGEAPAFTVSYGPAARARTIAGKPPGWTSAWTVVFVVWMLAAIIFVAVRADVGHLAVFAARETSAVREVRAAMLQPGVTNAQALAAFIKNVGPRRARATWSVQDRQWERRLYVMWELGRNQPIAWTVSYGGQVTADGSTVSTLKNALQAPAKSQTTLPSIPGL